jgi:hypothetical protein
LGKKCRLPEETLKLEKQIKEKLKAEIVKAEIVRRHWPAFLNFSFSTTSFPDFGLSPAL